MRVAGGLVLRPVAVWTFSGSAAAAARAPASALSLLLPKPINQIISPSVFNKAGHLQILHASRLDIPRAFFSTLAFISFRFMTVCVMKFKILL